MSRDDAVAQIFQEMTERRMAELFGQQAVELARNTPCSWDLIFQSEIDALTYKLEREGHHIWFTCEVDGVEYRLAARKD